MSEGYATQNAVRGLSKSARPKVAKSRPSYYTDAELARLWPELAYRPVMLANVSRRRFLRGLGACLALPAFESLRLSGAYAAAPGAAGGPLAASASGAPVGLACRPAGVESSRPRRRTPRDP